ncbi:SAM-dependent methyltransferase [Devosia limi DSM 17137]|uniref:Methyltransferase domain-containing protein n=1 Tax=Devosia limi DSM 17137 TaxID=1121477 RepID=A0A0F5LSM1_9HYPH|nr:methyltransferase domain-containing protein [Devosia limi]KKB85281.1 SAM-dependent methyltransferase [Devosia limi DSM 17137]SHF88320.1 Methyltransferase domain-containing protein [Devosia limi DSM 17137]
MADDPTLKFYADNAAVYAGRARDLPQAQLDAFLAQLPPGAAILELGTGGGQDAAHMLERGFAVTPTDASAALAAQAERRIGRPVRLMRFAELEEIATYDGVWASAALLHAPRSELTDDLTRIHRALRPGGLLVASFKAGSEEGRDSLGRYYNYLQAPALLAHFQAAAPWADLTLTERAGTGYDNVPTQWLWVSARA